MKAMRKIGLLATTRRFFNSNVTPELMSKVGRNLHLQKNHPINIIKSRIEKHFADTFTENGKPVFKTYDSLSPRVSTADCFDKLNVPADHQSRALSDTFYFTPDTILRTHTSVHQVPLLTEGNNAFLVTGDCYRRDEIDASHYPVFHQMEGVRIWPTKSISSPNFVVDDLKSTLGGMVDSLFGKVEKRWVDAYFPFTHPSVELEILYNGAWLEVLGSGVIHPHVLKEAGKSDHSGWAFGLGLERLAMVLFSIPDIRLFWSLDQRFLEQFASGSHNVTFKPFSKYPECYKDLSAWLRVPVDAETGVAPLHDNDMFALVRDVAGDLVEKVEVRDKFVHPKTGRESRCWRIHYRSLERSLTNVEIEQLQAEVRRRAGAQLPLELR